jgi:hypothetical protein
MPCPHDWTDGGETVTLAASLASGLSRKSVPAERRRPKLPLRGLAVACVLGDAAVEAEGLARVGLGPPEDELDPHESVRTAIVIQSAPRRISIETLRRSCYEAASTFLTPFGPGHFG